MSKKKPRKKTAVAIRRANSLKGWRTRRKMEQARKQAFVEKAQEVVEQERAPALPEPDFSGSDEKIHNP
jgi:hypothetical protein